MRERLPQALKAGIKKTIAASGSLSLLAPPLRSLQNYAFYHYGDTFRNQYVRFLSDSRILSSFEWNDRHHGRDIAIPVERDYQASWNVALSCLWSEPGVRRVLDRFIEINDGSKTFFDIGANHGYRSYPFLAAGYRCVMFEPQATCNEYIALTCRRNGFEPIVEQQLVGDENGVVDFWQSSCSWLSSAAIKPAGAGAAKQLKSETLDSYCARTGHQPSIVKIDVEGHEAAVFRGGEALLEGARPLIVVEVWHDSPHKHGMFDLTSRHGYQWYAVENDRLTGPLSRDEFAASPRSDFVVSADQSMAQALSR